jgi:two-component system, chemotaxis family, CheB/CheR fusion protein
MPNFAVAGIGASAEGLEAFVQLLKGLPPETGMAFVLVQHLEFKHDSQLAGLLEKATQVPACAVLRCLWPVGPRATREFDAADRLLSSSLAANCGEVAVGVILSGTGADGTAGVEAVNTGGGITFTGFRRPIV